MSIYFDFEVGQRGRRFRKAVDHDKAEIELIWNRKDTEKLFYVEDIGQLIELSTLPICMINDKMEVLGFLALSDHPKIAGVDPSCWEDWLRNMFQRFYLSRNTLFIHFMCCVDSVAEIFTEEALSSVFLNDPYLKYIVLLVPPSCKSDNLPRYQFFKKRYMYKYCSKSADDKEECMVMFVALRSDYCPQLKIRRAVEEDNNDIVAILNQKSSRLTDMYGDYYISEIIGRHPEMKRTIIVAEFQERAVGVMCLNNDVNYEMLQKTYELGSYQGLVKTSRVDKERSRRRNVLLRTFGDPIMLGKWSPFDKMPKLYTKHIADQSSRETVHSNIDVPKMACKKKKTRTLQENHPYPPTDWAPKSIDYSEYNSRSTSFSQMYDYSATFLLKDDDPFDYVITNIDHRLFAVPEMSVLELGSKRNSPDIKPPKSLPTKPPGRISGRISRRLKSQGKIDANAGVVKVGELNVFLIELFGLRKDIDDRRAFDLLEAAFEIMKNYDYCLIRVPCTENNFPLLQHFCFVPTKRDVCSKYALYIAHRSSVLSKIRVRRAELADIPQIAKLLENLDVKETMWTVEDTVVNAHRQNLTFVFICGLRLVGIAVMQQPNRIDLLRTMFNVDQYHLYKYHSIGQGLDNAFCELKTAIVYPVFEVHFRFFMRELLRLSGASTMVWLTAYRNKLLANKGNSLAVAMVPLLPRKTIVDQGLPMDLRRRLRFSKNALTFSVWFMDQKLSSVSRMNVDTRIVIVGASRTAMAFLNSLLFCDTATYLTYTNVTLISKKGLPYVRHVSAEAEMMFTKYRTFTDSYLKCVPYTYYVNIVQGTMVDINKQAKYVILENGSRYHYDLLFLFFGKLYQNPEYTKVMYEKQLSSSSPTKYVRLDVPRYIETEPHVFECTTPDNFFVINTVADAVKAVNYVKSLQSWRIEDGKVIVYGTTIHAYCCLSALLTFVSAEHIIFVEPFPHEDPKKPRVSTFCNYYVDHTIKDVLKKLNITVYRSCYFQSYMCDCNHRITHVEFISYFKKLTLECAALFFYGKRSIGSRAFVAMSKSCIPYDGGVLIDHEFRTSDPSIYAAGPATRYRGMYYADNLRLKFYDSEEIGKTLGSQIKNKLDPLFISKSAYTRNTKVSFQKNDETDSSSKASSPVKSSASSKSSAIKMDNPNADHSPRQDSETISPSARLPVLTKPHVWHCILPGGLQYLEVRPPGIMLPHYYLHSMDYKGHVMETLKNGGYFKLHFTNDFIVDGITCLTPDNRHTLEYLKVLYGMPAGTLNNVHLRYNAKMIDDFFEFFRAPWAMFLYHEQLKEFLALSKELTPKNNPHAPSLQQSLVTTAEKLSSMKNTTDLTEIKWLMRARFGRSPHSEAITEYVIEWLSQNEFLMPMYIQPCQVVQFSQPLVDYPVYRRRRRSVTTMLRHNI